MEEAQLCACKGSHTFATSPFVLHPENTWPSCWCGCAVLPCFGCLPSWFLKATFSSGAGREWLGASLLVLGDFKLTLAILCFLALPSVAHSFEFVSTQLILSHKLCVCSFLQSIWQFNFFSFPLFSIDLTTHFHFL